MGSLEFVCTALRRDVEKAGVDKGEYRKYSANGKKDIVNNHPKKGEESAVLAAGNRIIEGKSLNHNCVHGKKD